MKNEENENKRVTFQVSEDFYHIILEEAKKQDRSLSSYIRQALVNMREQVNARG
jgi:predicted HicB family RNase H-like nuclease